MMSETASIGSVALLCGAKHVPDQNLDLKERVHLSIDNTGNFFFQEALRRQVRHDTTVGHLKANMTGIKTLVMSLANFIRPTVDMESEAKHLEKSGVENLVLIGAGAQAYEYSENLTIPPGTLRFLKVVSERSASIGARGEYTADLLARNGIKNVDVIGCPSIFWNCDPDFRIDGTRHGSPFVGNIGIHSTPSGYYRDKISALLSFGHKHDAYYVFQNENHIVPLLRRGETLTPEEEKDLTFFIHYYNNGCASPAELREWLARRLVCFFDVNEWMGFLKGLDLVVGCRFHGNVAAALAGVPSLSLVFDTRTKELCETTGLPFMLLEDFSEEMSPEQIRDLADYSEFNATFAQKYARFVDFVERNGLDHNLRKASVGAEEAGSGPSQQARVGELFTTKDPKTRAVETYVDDLRWAGHEPTSLGLLNRMRDLRCRERREAAEKTPPTRVGEHSPVGIDRTAASGKRQGLIPGSSARPGANGPVPAPGHKAKDGVSRLQWQFAKLSDALEAMRPGEAQALKRVCLVTNELAELHQNGGIGTANSGLLKDLISAGALVQVLYSAPVDRASEPVARAVDALNAIGAEIEFLQDHVPPEWMHSPRQISYGCYAYLKEREFDLIHFNDYLGNGFYAAQARRLGVALPGTPVVVTVHGPTQWAMEADERPLHDLGQQEICFLEFKALEYADAVLGVSLHLLNWLQSRSVKLPEATYVHKNVLPRLAARRGQGCLAPGELSELVFFARQDVRKGFRVFLKAVRLVAEQAPWLKITFLGKFSRIGWEHSGGVALDELKDVPNLLNFRHNSDRNQALAYLQRPGVLAVMPSLDENSPCTVIECIDAGIPFLASAVGGIPELLSDDAQQAVLVRPDPQSLAKRILQVLDAGIAVPDLAFARERVATEMRSFFAHLVGDVRERDQQKQERIEKTKPPLVSVCITHFNRSRMLANLLRSIEEQTYPNFEVIVVDDGSTNPHDRQFVRSLQEGQFRYPLRVVEIENSYLGAARNAAVLAAKGEFLKFQDDDNIPLPHEIETFVKGAVWADADVVTAFAHVFRYESERTSTPAWKNLTYFPLGACLPIGFFRNDYGDANALVRRTCFDALGGFTEHKGVGCEDYEFFAKAEMMGFRVHAIPEPLFWYRASASGMLRTTPFYQNANRGRAALKACERPWVQAILDHAHGTHLHNEIRHKAEHDAGTRPFGDLHRQLLEFDPNDQRTVDRLIALALRYERYEDVMPLVLRTSGVAEARRWLDETGRKLRQANVSGRQFLSGRDAVILMQEASEFHLLEPSGDLPTWPLLSMSEHGLLVHPLNGRTTKALVPKFIPSHASSVSVVFFHASRLGKPVQMCFEVLSLGQSVAASEWITVEPGEEILTKVEFKSPLGCDADLIIGSKETGGQDNAWAYAKQVIISSRLTA